jgi:hypothetical protein
MDPLVLASLSLKRSVLVVRNFVVIGFVKVGRQVDRVIHQAVRAPT